MKKTAILGIALALILVMFINLTSKTVYAENTTTYQAKAAVLMSPETGEVLFEQNSEDQLQIASMVKIMTLNLIFEEIENGNLSIEDEVTVSENASSMGGSQAFLDANNVYKADELIKSIVVASANDSCVAMAEKICGSVSSFVAKMNAKAESLGMDNTYFANCTGLPAPNQYSCAKDVAIMFRELIGHNKFFDYSNIWMYDLVHPSGRTTSLSNTNKLIRFYEGCDGGKTGYTDEAKSCLAATAKRGNTRFISVIVGAPDSKTRNAQISKMLNEAFATYETNQYVFSDVEFAEVDVKGGKEKTVKCLPAEDYFLMSKKGENPNVETEVIFDNVKAPLVVNQQIGKINVYVDGELKKSINLLSMSDIDRAGVRDFIDDLINNW